MKNLFWIVTFTLVIVTVASCSMETDNEANATISYSGVCDSVVFADTADTVYGKYITAVIASKAVALIGDSSSFQESATSTDGFLQNAVSLCSQKAMTTYSNKINGITSTSIRQYMQIAYGDTVSFDNLDDFTLHCSLYGFLSNTSTYVASFSKRYNK